MYYILSYIFAYSSISSLSFSSFPLLICFFLISTATIFFTFKLDYYSILICSFFWFNNILTLEYVLHIAIIFLKSK